VFGVIELLLLTMLASLTVAATTPFTLISLFILSSLLYATPALWLQDVPAEVAASWSMVLTLALVAQLAMSHSRAANFSQVHGARFQLPGGKGDKLALVTNVTINGLLLFAFGLIILGSGGVGIFFEGKYGGVPGGSLLLYYTWNSLLLISVCSNIYYRRLLTPWTLLGLIQVGLIFVSGDRTIPFLVASAIFYRYFQGLAPARLPKNARMALLSSFFVIPFAAVSKSIYAILPTHGFSSKTMSLVSENFWEFAAKDFEPSHVMLMFNRIVAHEMSFDSGTFLWGLLAVLPFSTELGVDPHAFSNQVKARFFSTWGAESGVGANFWAEGYALLGLAGVLIFACLVIGTLWYIDRKVSKTSIGVGQATWLACGVIVAFYVHRNSLEQMLAFLGRYAIIGALSAVATALVFGFVTNRKTAVPSMISRSRPPDWRKRRMGSMRDSGGARRG
jgi:hypothetical protein